MSRCTSLVLLLILCTLPAAADEFSAQHITVYGTATLEVAPDQMLWRVNVRTIDPQSARAALAHGDEIAAVLSLLRARDIAESTIQTSRMQLGENWSQSDGSRVRDGFYASTDVSFTSVNLGDYAAIWTGLSALQGVSVRNVEVGLADRIRHQNDARVAAVKAARDKAQAIADALGARLGEPLFVEEELMESRNTAMPAFSNVAMSAGGPGDGGEFVAPGTIPVQARVRAAFRLLTGK